MKTALLFLLGLGAAFAEPVVINDPALIANFQRKLGKIADKEEFPTADSFAKGLSDISRSIELPSTAADSSPEDPAESVFLISSVYKCGKCDKWHIGGVATAWALTTDGLMVTNHHVFEKAKGAAMGVCDREGNVHIITEVVAQNQENDVAIFKVKAGDLKPLALGTPAAIGSRVHVISHPHKRFFMHTFGDVSRYFRRPGKDDRKASTVMSITADYAKGSSGGPVLDTDGRVVGMVSSTQSIYYESDNGQPKGPLQMVVKNCVPVSAILQTLEAPAREADKAEAQR
ncbi:peptidase S1 and S6 chymotrypsin/Hap [Haloferula helveola]|uniref:Peptidase S1 and S6 chymotrypsin/Hap n=1 Tax=Haloferula helveola TaxID=490095 RepID=A0ABM7RGH5_9BACT|nr:peptidase S1 and S6 chymotrypsin/Hap [Haloferula helveola]